MFELLDHTADVGILASGRNTAEAFAEAAHGFCAVVVEDPATVQERETRSVEVMARDEADLLVAWINELVFLQDTHAFLVRRADIQEMSATRMRAVLHGEDFDPSRHRVRTQVKAATYHQLRVDHNGGCHVQIILDI